MRSGTPKVLHELCGLPMVLWPRARGAARRRGAGRRRRLAGARARAPCCPRASSWPCSSAPTAPAAPSRAALEALGGRLDDAERRSSCSAATCRSSAPRRSTELVDAHRDSGAAATMATTVLADPSGYGRVVRDADGAVERVVETKRQGDSTQAEREIREVNTGIFVFAAGALRAALPRLSADNAQGELYLPQVLDLLRADGARIVGAPHRRPAARARRQRPRRPRRGARPRPAGDPPPPHARRRDDRRPGARP